MKTLSQTTVSGFAVMDFGEPDDDERLRCHTFVTQ